MASVDVISISSSVKPQSNALFTMSSSPGLPSPSELFKRAPTLRTGSRATTVPSAASATYTTASSLLKAGARESHSIESIRKFDAPFVAEKELVQKGTTSKVKPRKSRAKKPGSAVEKGKKSLDSASDTKVEDRATPKAASGTKHVEMATKTAPGAKTLLVPLDKDSPNLMSNCGYNGGEALHQQGTPIRVTTEVAVTRKRKSPEISKAAPVASKPKTTRKKAKTITDQATAAYGTEIPEVEADLDLTKRPGAITDFFSYQPKPGDNPKGSKASKTGSKPAKSSKVKPGDRELPILLSPDSAIKHCNMQDVVFGTSSQLAREDSPTLIRDLQETMKASNAIDDDWCETTNDSSSNSATTSQRILSHVGRSNLWAASSRDEYGKLLEAEFIDLSLTPVAKVNVPPVHLAKGETIITQSTKLDDEARDVGDSRTSHTRVGEGESTISTKSMGPVDTVSEKAIIDGSAKAPKPKPATRKPRSNAKKATSSERPDYSLNTTFQLTNAVASFGFKTVKRREQMITLLNKCWDSQHGVNPPDEDVSGQVTSVAPEPSKKTKAPQTPTKRPRGRPKKVVEADTSKPVSEKRALSPQPDAAIQLNEPESDSEEKPLILQRPPKKSKAKAKEKDEIPDSDTALTPSPSRRKAAKKKAPAPLPLKLAADTDSSDEKVSRAELWLHITKAIKSEPPATSSSEPNWHEKMLLYDPIVCEDLTVWLNTGGLQRAGWDGEVYPLEVKSWCESKGVCCLMRENLRGGARSRW